MVAQLRQDAYEPAPFDVSKVNVHSSERQPSSTLAIFIHGLSGSGYETWGDFPRYLFDDTDQGRCDVALFDYVSGLRRLRTRKAMMDFYVEQTVEAIRQTEAEYDAIFLVGHSLGGIVAEEAAVSYLQGRPPSEYRVVSPLASVIYMGSPRAGSGWALPLVRNLGDDLRKLRPMSSHSAETNNYLTDRTAVALTSPLDADHVFLPRYAFYSGTDLWVSRFSSTFGIPTRQQIPLAVSHTAMPKPLGSQAEQVLRLRSIIRDVVEARRQRRRELIHARAHGVAPVTAVSPTVTTELWFPTNGSRWVQVYNEIRKTATNADVSVLDVNGFPESSVDLLISISNADDVTGSQPMERNRFDEARARRDASSRLTVGIVPVGPTADTAVAVIQGWHHAAGPTSSVYIEGATDTASLRNIMTQWIQLEVSKDPRRGRADLSTQDASLLQGDRLYDVRNGGTH